jgi:deazaflavin-dependent oxidoreductase (nitroreductase family)
VPKFPKVALAVTGAVVGVAMAYPPSRRHAARTARVALDELMLRADHPWSDRLVLLTSEGHRSRLPRTTVLNSVDWKGELFVVPWQRRAHWLANVAANPEVVLDDRVHVRRARAEVVDGKEADAVRGEYLRQNVPGPLRELIGGDAGPLGPGLPVVRLTRR